MKMMKRVSFLLAFLLVFNMLAPVQNVVTMNVNASMNYDGYMLGAGTDHSVMLKPDGTVWTWGAGSKGQLGHSTLEHSDEPKQIVTLANIKQISIGDYYNLALDNDGAIWAWGENGAGQLGLGDNITKNEPVKIQGLPEIVKIDAGVTHSIALDVQGNVYVWGDNYHGKLGTGSSNHENLPVKLNNLSSIVDITANIDNSAVLAGDGKVYTWGNNSKGTLGNGTTTSSTVPIEADLSNVVGTVKEIYSGRNMFYLVTDTDKLYSWGNYLYGQIMDETNETRLKPELVTYFENVKKVVVSQYSTFILEEALDGSRDWYGVGMSNKYQLLTNVPYTTNSVPTKLITNRELVHIGSGFYHTLAIDSNGKLLAWGSNDNGEFGVGSVYIKTPTINPNLSGITDIASGDSHTLLVNNLGNLVVYGTSSRGQLGTGGYATEYLPNEIDMTYDVVKVSAGSEHSMLSDSNGDFYIWGNNSKGQVGIPGESLYLSPQKIELLSGATDFSGGYVLTYVSTTSGTYAFGHNEAGALGTGANNKVESPFKMLPTSSQVTCGNKFGIYHQNGKLFGVGENSSGQLGLGNSIDTPNETESKTIDVFDIDAGNEHTLLLDTSNTVWSTGGNAVGQLGDGTQINKNIYEVVPGLPNNIVDVDTYSDTSYAVDVNGDLWAWGENSNYQLGDGTNVSSLTPVFIDMPEKIKKIASGEGFAQALAESGNVYVWGYSAGGRLGLGTSDISTTAVEVMQLTGTIIDSEAPTAPSNIAATNITQRTLSLMWTKSIDNVVVTGYNISVDGIDTTTVTGNYCTLKNLNPGQSYTIAIKALDSSGNESVSNSVVISTEESTVMNMDGYKIDAGIDHSILLKPDGTVWTWGNGNDGRLGHGSTGSIDTPKQIEALSNIRDIKADDTFNLALDNNGKVWSWGDNTHGQLGLGDKIDRSTPEEITTLSDVNILDAGDRHGIVLTNSGEVYTWGDGLYGRIGNGNTADQMSPVLIDSLTNIIDVKANGGSCIALDADGNVFTWGRNVHGQLGDGTTIDSSSPVPVDLTNVNGKPIRIEAGRYNFYILTDTNRLYGWGECGYGQVGNGEKISPLIPTEITFFNDIQDIVVGDYSTFVLDKLVNETTEWYGLGLGAQGQLLTGNFYTYNTSPLPLQYDGEIFTLASARFHTLAIDSTGNLLAWGRNDYGEFGDDSTYIEEPILHPTLSGIQDIKSGESHTIALKTNGNLDVYGIGLSGQLGSGNSATQYSPYEIDHVYDVKQIAAGKNHSMLVDLNGDFYIWGDNSNGQVGIPGESKYFTPQKIDILHDTKSISGGEYHTYVSTVDKTYSFGDNYSGVIGDGTTNDRHTPYELLNTSSMVTAGNKFSMIYESNNVYGIGENSIGQIATGDYIDTNSLILSKSIDVLDIDAGDAHTLLLDTSNTVWATGSNQSGQLGAGILNCRNTFEIISGLPTNIIDVDTYSNTSYAVDMNGDVWAWGSNESYQLGYGSNVNSTSPILLDMPEVIIKVSSGGGFAQAIAESGNVYVWGYSAGGRLGLGTSDTSTTPVEVMQLTGSTLDVEAPTVPTNIVTTEVLHNTITVNWDASTDNIAIANYTVSINGQETTGITGTSHTFSGLTAETAYDITVKAVDTSGNESACSSSLSATTTVAPDTEAPTVPENISTTSKTETSISLTWTASTDNVAVTEYRVYVDGVEKYIVANNTCTIDGLAAGTEYSFTVKALDASGNESALSAAFAVSTEVDAIERYYNSPAGVKYSSYSDNGTYTGQTIPAESQTLQLNDPKPGFDEIYVSWNLVAGDVNYELEVDGIIIDLKYQRDYLHTDLNPNTTHSYRVRSYNADGYTVWSAYKYVMTGMKTPVKPEGIVEIPEDDNVILTWAYDPNITEYVVKFNGKEYTGIDKNFFKISNLEKSTAYTYQINALNPANPNGSGFTAEATVTTKALKTPTTYVDEMNFIVSWDAIEGATKYKVQVNQGAILETNQVSLALKDVISNIEREDTLYAIRVKAIDGALESHWSEYYIFKTAPKAPEQITDITALVLDDFVKLHWTYTGEEEIVSYDIMVDPYLDEYGNVVDGILIENGVEGNATDQQTYTHDYVGAFTEHTYSLRANTLIAFGEWSDVVEVTAMAGLPEPPKEVKVDSVGTITTLSWEDVPGATGYEIYVFDDYQNDTSRTGTVYRVSKPEYVHRGTTLGSEELYQVRTVNALGTGEWTGYIINNSMRLTSQYGQDVELNLTASQITDFSPYTLNVYYNEDVLELKDLSGLTPVIEDGIGEIKIGDDVITITDFEEGHITFVVDKEIEIGYTWEGIINNILFEGKISGGTTLDYTVFVDENVKWEGIGNE